MAPPRVRPASLHAAAGGDEFNVHAPEALNTQEMGNLISIDPLPVIGYSPRSCSATVNVLLYQPAPGLVHGEAYGVPVLALKLIRRSRTVNFTFVGKAEILAILKIIPVDASALSPMGVNCCDVADIGKSVATRPAKELGVPNSKQKIMSIFLIMIRLFRIGLTKASGQNTRKT